MTDSQNKEKPRNPQIVRAAEVLKGISEVVTEDDRKDALTMALPDRTITKETVYRYLKGDVRNMDTAAGLIGFFTKRIEEREAVISQGLKVANG